MIDTYRTGLVISRLVRLVNSANGNPRYEVIFTDGTSGRTAPDSTIGGQISNSEYRDTPLWVAFNAKGEITRARRMDGGA